MSKKKKKSSPVVPVEETIKTADANISEEAVEEKALSEEAKDSTDTSDKSVKDNQGLGTKVKSAIKKVGQNSSIKELDDNIKEALSENVDELTNTDSETATAAAAHINLKQVGATLFGFFVIVFAVIGIIATGIKVSDYVKSLNDDSKLVSSFESLVLPLAACDAAVFEDVTALSEDVLITAACWDAILKPSELFASESGYYTVSYLDIDVRISKLFGTGLTYTHKTVGDSEVLFEYDEETGMYTLPAYPKTVSYLPILESYTKTESGYELRIKYVYPVTTIISGTTSTEKIMIYNVAQKDLGYVITSLEIGELITGQEL